jgi:hypothetical protein
MEVIVGLDRKKKKKQRAFLGADREEKANDKGP